MNSPRPHKARNGPWFHPMTQRLFITVLMLLLLGTSLAVLLFRHTEMSALEGALVGTLVGSIATSWKDVVGWWFRNDRDNEGEQAEVVEQDADPTSLKDTALDADKRRLPDDF